MHSRYVPRPARLTLTLESVRVLDIQMENGQARALVRAWRAFRGCVSPAMHDRDVVEMLISSMLLGAQELREIGYEEGSYSERDGLESIEATETSARRGGP